MATKTEISEANELLKAMVGSGRIDPDLARILTIFNEDLKAPKFEKEDQTKKNWRKTSKQMEEEG